MPTDAFEVASVVKSLNNSNSTGYDEVATKVLKGCAKELAPVLAYLINLSFTEGTFPSNLKQSIVMPLFKAGDKDDINNYRPITLIPIIAKIFEKTMHKRLTSFLLKHNIILKEQNGFQKGKSTTLACFSLVKEIAECIDRKIPVTGVFFDMSKAFDYVCHEKLLSKCYQYGIRGQANDWLKSYLCNRTQYVEIACLNDNKEVMAHRSELKLNPKGVPQGSVLGPLLFILYVNDLPDITSYNCTLFADDISIVIKYNKNLAYNLEINNTVNDIIEWLTANNLSVNIKKTMYMQYYNKNGKKNDLNINYIMTS